MYGVSHLLCNMWKYVTVKYVWQACYMWWYTPVTSHPLLLKSISTCHLSLPCRLQISGAICGPGLLSSYSISDIRTKRSLAILVAIPIIIDFPSVTLEVLIQPFASNMQIVLVGKKDLCGKSWSVLTSLSAHWQNQNLLSGLFSVSFCSHSTNFSFSTGGGFLCSQHLSHVAWDSAMWWYTLQTSQIEDFKGPDVFQFTYCLDFSPQQNQGLRTSLTN
jgi:hypothetical protein